MQYNQWEGSCSIIGWNLDDDDTIWDNIKII